MARIVEVVSYIFGRELGLHTPGTYATDVAVEILKYLEADLGAQIKDTGWKHGYGLEVSVGLPIRLESSVAELDIDGGGICIKRVSGSADEFDEMCAAIRERIVSNG